MKLMVNGETKQLNSDSLTVADLLVAEGVEMPEMVTVQYNGEFVEKDSYKKQALTEGDAIEFLYFMGGGSPQ